MKKPAPKKQLLNVSRWLIPTLSVLVVLGLTGVAFYFQNKRTQIQKELVITPENSPQQQGDNIVLPKPTYKSSNSIEAVLKQRRTRRSFEESTLDLATVSQMLWAGQGVTSDWGGRTAPSAKSTYPLNLYLVTNAVVGLEAGQYLYVPGDREMVHQLKPIKKGSFGEIIFNALNQNSFKNIPATIVVTGNMSKMANAFGGQPHDKDVYLEAGHVAQNLYLQAESLKIGMVVNTSFNDSIIRNIISIPEEETIIYLIPVGHAKN